MGAKPGVLARQSAQKTSPSQTAGPAAPHEPFDVAPEERIRLVLSMIPRGRVTTYGSIARLAGLPNRARLVGRVLAQLPDTSRLPWHRVVNAARRLSPRGDPAALARQRTRLEAEGVRFTADRVVAEHLWQP